VIERLVILGAGDVTTRYVFPALAQLERAGHLPDDFAAYVVGRDDHDSRWLRDSAAEAMSGDDVPEGLLERLHYHRGDATEADDLRGLLTDEPAAVYLALPAQVFHDAISAVIDADVHQGSRVVVEKPFGHDAESAATLNELVHRRFDEHDVIRVDHFLGLQTTHNIVAARFANRLFEPMWNREHIERIEVVWDETLALEGRAGYYEGTGAARDMLQNHLLQLLCLVTMEPPADFGHDAVADRKLDVLRSLRPWEDATTAAVRARYTAGEVEGHHVDAYLDEDGVAADSTTETYAAFTMELKTDRWAGVPMLMRSGKALARDRHEVAVHLRPSTCGIDTDGGDVIRFEVAPDAVSLGLHLSDGEQLTDVTPHELMHKLPAADLAPYAALLRQVLAGERQISVRDDEAVEAWRAVAPLLEAFESDEVPMLEYAAGSKGPDVPG
jgi:glucose-6-phosphate 1-dehydrogenase